jgi:hypothetical protein
MEAIGRHSSVYFVNRAVNTSDKEGEYGGWIRKAQDRADNKNVLVMGRTMRIYKARDGSRDAGVRDVKRVRVVGWGEGFNECSSRRRKIIKPVAKGQGNGRRSEGPRSF